jgi:pSer/pThr/pTyr-binding forkhead associated (FHA) protein
MPKGFLIAQRGNVIGNRYMLRNGQTSLGRNADNDIVLDEVAVSRYHAVIRFDDKTGEVSVMDLGSTNGVSVNNTDIKSGVPYKLQHRDTVFIGRVALNIQIRPDNQPMQRLPTEDTDRTAKLNLAPLYRHATARLDPSEYLETVGS